MSLVAQKHHNCPTCRCTEPLDEVSESALNGGLGCSTKTVMMPRELTVENGAKYLFSGTFYSEIVVQCEDCDDGWLDEEAGEECPTCKGSGTCTMKVPVEWTTIKEIYAMAVKHLAT